MTPAAPARGSHLSRIAFHALCRLGAPIGGVRPRRIYHWLAHRAFAEPASESDGFDWYRDRWGFEFLLHPFYHLDRQIIAFGSYEPDLIPFLRERIVPGSVCFDVGANLGQIAVHMADRAGPTGTVHAFEPVPHIAARLLAHAERNGFRDRMRVHDVALSDRTGVERMWGAAPSAENQGMASLVSTAARGAELAVATERLDDFVERIGVARLDWIKVDIQGAEPLFLRGAERTLRALAGSSRAGHPRSVPRSELRRRQRLLHPTRAVMGAARTLVAHVVDTGRFPGIFPFEVTSHMTPVSSRLRRRCCPGPTWARQRDRC
jgi:FkbM family methyltransferase